MQLLNGTSMPAAYTLGRDPDAREWLIVVVKGTFAFPAADAPVGLAAEQLPIVESDTFTGDPGLSAPLLESDFALRKRRCDVLLVGSAYAPGRPARRVEVGVRVGPLKKEFAVLGPRRWRRSLFGLKPTRPARFAKQPISYDVAFGGAVALPRGGTDTFLANPIGIGYHARRRRKDAAGMPAPQTEELRRRVRKPNGKYVPMSYGAIGRAWAPRAGYAGTYDQRWLDEVFPFLPHDFNEAYFQAAPRDQQIPFPRGGERISLRNLTPEGHLDFTLPDLSVPFEVKRAGAGWERVDLVADTIVLEPDERRFSVTWRATLPVRRSPFEFRQAVVGRMTPGWYRARKTGKLYYSSVAQLVEQRGPAFD